MRTRTKPSQKAKYKYVVFRIHSSDSIKYNDLRNAVTNALMNWMGEKNFSEAGACLIRNLCHDGKCFIKCDPKHVDNVKMALMLVHQIGDERVVFQSLRVTGTIKSGKEKI